MTTKETLQVGDPIIREVAKEVIDVSGAEVKATIEDLVETMRDQNLIGMAAPQIGVSLRIFVTEVRKTQFRSHEELDELRVFVNPEIISTSGEMAVQWEGCGSVAESGLFAQVERPASVKVKAVNENGEIFTHEATGLLSAVIQHEIDHLNGVLFVDRMDSKTCISKSEYLKMKTQSTKNTNKERARLAP